MSWVARFGSVVMFKESRGGTKGGYLRAESEILRHNLNVDLSLFLLGRCHVETIVYQRDHQRTLELVGFSKVSVASALLGCRSFSPVEAGVDSE